MRELKNIPRRGSHLPVLMKLVPLTTGPILELGCGVFSTIYLHWACYAAKRRLITYEDNPAFYRFIQRYANDYHEIRCIKDWAELDPAENWSVAFVDHGQEARRYLDIARLTHAEYVVAHDAENGNAHKYHYERIYKLFKSRYKYGGASPHTAVFSNTHDLTGFTV